MKVQRICPGCGAKVQFDDEKSKKILCPNCHNVYGVGQFLMMKNVPKGHTPGASSPGGVTPEPPVAGEKLECPHCHRSLKLSSGKSPKTVKCPGCGHVGELFEFSVNNLRPNPEVTEFVDDDETIKVGPVEGKTEILNLDNMRPGFLLLQSDNGSWFGNKTVELHMGKNEIGRSSNMVTVNTPLPTRDELMSRRHIVIEMRQTKHGTIEHNLRDMGSKNGTKVNGNRLGAHDVITLQPGNIIEIGNTKLRFEVAR